MGGRETIEKQPQMTPNLYPNQGDGSNWYLENVPIVTPAWGNTRGVEGRGGGELEN